MRGVTQGKARFRRKTPAGHLWGRQHGSRLSLLGQAVDGAPGADLMGGGGLCSHRRSSPREKFSLASGGFQGCGKCLLL